MITCRQLLIAQLQAIGADGLCLKLVPDEIDCGCGIDDLAPCLSDCLMCIPAKLHSDGLYYPMEDV